MWSLEMTSDDLEITSQFGTWKELPANQCNAGELPEVTATAVSCENCWKLQMARTAI